MKTDPNVRQTRVVRHTGGGLGKPPWAWAACWLCLLSGCAHDPAIEGLRPVSPPQRMGAELSGGVARLEFPKVASNMPVLEWQAYEPPPSLAANAAAPSHVSYDLRIWQMQYGRSASLVYEKTALPAPTHQVERWLKPGTPHFWSVRARVASGGQTRFTDWSHSLRPCQPLTSVDGASEIPAPNYFRVVTPGGQNAPATCELVSELVSWNELFATSLPSAETDAGGKMSELASWGALFAGNNPW